MKKVKRVKSRKAMPQKLLRVWLLGDRKQEFFPTKEVCDKFAALLSAAHNQDTGIVDLIWGPYLQVIELPLEAGIKLNDSDLVVSSQELSDALKLVKQKRGKVA